MIRSRSYSR
jgi:hypothetical protein